MKYLTALFILLSCNTEYPSKPFYKFRSVEMDEKLKQFQTSHSDTLKTCETFVDEQVFFFSPYRSRNHKATRELYKRFTLDLYHDVVKGCPCESPSNNCFLYVAFYGMTEEDGQPWTTRYDYTIGKMNGVGFIDDDVISE